MKTLALAILSLALLAACQASSETTPPSAIPGAPEVAVSMNEMSFTPAQIHLASSGVNLLVRNDGRKRHDLTITGLNVRIVLEPGQSVTAGLRDLPKGQYEAYCSEFGHKNDGMVATVVVE